MAWDSVPLAGRTALVVGTSPNIGAGIAAELGRAGAAVGCVDRDPHLAALAAKDIGDDGAAPTPSAPTRPTRPRSATRSAKSPTRWVPSTCWSTVR